MLGVRKAKRARTNGWETHTSAYEQKSNFLKEESERIDQCYKELNEQKETLAQEHGDPNVSDEDQIEINVGGRIITTTRGTLTQQKGTMLEALFCGRWEKELLHDEAGRIFLDMNP
eukprot:12168227-Ditylum_brightwellii.AAC.1